jgi:hypothetical protein
LEEQNGVFQKLCHNRKVEGLAPQGHYLGNDLEIRVGQQKEGKFIKQNTKTF